MKAWQWRRGYTDSAQSAQTARKYMRQANAHFNAAMRQRLPNLGCGGCIPAESRQQQEVAARRPPSQNVRIRRTGPMPSDFGHTASAALRRNPASPASGSARQVWYVSCTHTHRRAPARTHTHRHYSRGKLAPSAFLHAARASCAWRWPSSCAPRSSASCARPWWVQALGPFSRTASAISLPASSTLPP